MVESGMDARLIQESFQTPLEVTPKVTRLRRHAMIGRTGGDIGGQVFLDRNPFVQVVVKTQIRHSEAAETENPHEFVFLQPIPLGQGVEWMLRVVHGVVLISWSNAKPIQGGQDALGPG